MRFNKNVFWLTFLVMLATPAYAEPATISLIGGWLMNVGYSLAISALVSSVFGGGKSKNLGSAANSGGVLVNKQGSNDAIPVVYGAVRMGGTRVYIETSNGSGDTGGTKFLNIVLAMCEGRIGSISQVLFNDIVIWKSTSAGGSGTLVDLNTGAWRLENFETSKYNNSKFLGIVFHEGRDGQARDQMIQDSVGATAWSNEHKLSGVCYLALKMEADPEVYQGGVPLVTAITTGKHITDVSSITQGDITRSTYASADPNPVDVLYDYLINERYGKGLDHPETGVYSAGSDIDLESFKQARIDATGKYAINGTIDTEDKLYENIQNLLDSFNGLLTYTAGKYKLQIRKPGETAVQTFTTENILGNIQIAGGEKRYRLNKLNTTWRNPASEYNDDTLIVDNATYLAQDSDTVLELNTENRLITSESILTDIANWKLDNSRYQMTINFTAPHTALTLECGDIIAVTHEIAGWNNKLFRAVSMNITPENTVEIAALEYNSSVQI